MIKVIEPERTCPRDRLVFLFVWLHAFKVSLIREMKPNTFGEIRRRHNVKHIQGEGPNWVLLVGGALLSTLSIRIGCKLKQVFYRKLVDKDRDCFKENGKSFDKEKLMACPLHANMFCLKQKEGSCYYCVAAGISESGEDMKGVPTSPTSRESHPSLPLVIIPARESNGENGVMWAASPDRLEPPRKQFHHHSNSSESPCVSDSGSDVLIKREVIHKLRQQLKSRDEMILEMQSQISDLQNSLSSQITHSANLQSQIDSANQDLFYSEREIQRLRKAIADHCITEYGSLDNSGLAPNWHSDTNGHANELELDFISVEKGRDGEKLEMLRREVQELKEVIAGKEFLLQNYKEQKVELCTTVQELQVRLECQVPNIL